MRAFTSFAAAMVALSILFALPAFAQQGPPPGAPPSLPDSVIAMIEEFRGLEQTLNELQNQAMAASPELQAQEEALNERVQEAMYEIDPELEAQMERMEGLESEMQEAQANQNQQRIQSLITEARAIEQDFRAAQAQAMEREAIAQSVEEFEAAVMEEMMAIDPTAQDKLDQLMALGARIQAATEIPEGG